MLLLTTCAEQTSTIDFAALPEADQRELVNAEASFTLHPDLALQTFAGEPMLTNPTNLDIDERGRAWVCTAQNYRRFNHDHPAKEDGDQILILEDTNGDGQADSRKVFYQGADVDAALGIAKLGDKVYVAASPNVLVFTDADGDDVPEKKDTLFTGLEGLDHDHGVHAVVFGPDGKLYFNFGNAGKRLRLKNGELARDKWGNTVEEGQTFRQGMVFRCNADGSDLEILGHNFRNNFEVAVDAYGRMWQSDNDDDGNEGARINFVMDYGNYGFTDEVTGAGWRKERVGMHDEIPKRHWHLNDPGVVPNLLQTGSGSPTGILIYEGEELPEVFRGEMIHCEPGHNVVRSYPVQAAGAGFTAEVVPLMTSSDTWFRPSDVCAAPDGSLLVADWYDSGVGGHLMGDIERGRIYRLHAKGNEAYTVSPPDLESITGAVAALGHVNQATRYLAYERLRQDPEAAEVLETQLLDPSIASRDRARTAWLLAEIQQSATSIIPILQASEAAELQATALRMARQYPGTKNRDLLAAVAQATQQNSPPVWREAALSLRHVTGAEADKLWAQLAAKYDGQDRWYLEALGIGSDLRAGARFAAWMATNPDLATPASKNLVWRSRAKAALPYVHELLLAGKHEADIARYFRALHFHDPSAVAPVIEAALFAKDHPQQNTLAQFAIGSLNPVTFQQNAKIQRRIMELLPEIRGTDSWPTVIENAALKSELPELIQVAMNNPDNDFQDRAAKLVAKLGDLDLIKNTFEQEDALGKDRFLHLARHMQNGETQEWLKKVRKDESLPLALRKRATTSLANYWNGMPYLLAEVQSGQLEAEEAEYVARALTQCWRTDVRTSAVDWLRENRSGDAIDLEAVLAMEGNAVAGKAVYKEYCASCHVVQGEGVNFGPELSKIGDKLGKDALLAAIVYPSQGIGFGYEGFTLTLKDGQSYTGYIASQTENEYSLQMMGGSTRTITKNDVVEKTPLAESLMTAGLHELMNTQEVGDLLAYLEGLREGQMSR